MLYDFFERLMMVVVGFVVLLAFGVCGILIHGAINEVEGEVIAKYYDDPDIVCGKTCIPVDECWTIEVGGNPWWDDTICYTKTDYDKINVGDYIEEN